MKYVTEYFYNGRITRLTTTVGIVWASIFEVSGCMGGSDGGGDCGFWGGIGKVVSPLSTFGGRVNWGFLDPVKKTH